jgi:AcrR family transcriptional regulator
MAKSLSLPAVTERERTLLATAELWSEEGYEGLTAERICDRAGIERTTFASEFGNVKAVAQAALEAPIKTVVSLVAAEYALDRSEPESCAFGIVAILEFMAANPAFAYVLYIGRREAVPSGVTLSSRPAHRFIVAMLERLRESSGLAGQPMAAGSGALGSPEAVLRREVLAGRSKRLPFLAADVIYGATVPFVGQVEALRLGRRAEERVTSRFARH